MNEQEVLQILDRVSAVITESHVVYTSGKHGPAYVNKDAVYPHTADTSHLCRAIAERFADDKVEVVIAPAVGGIPLSQWTAHHLSEICGHEVLSVYAEKETIAIPDPEGLGRKCFVETGGFVIKRGYDKLIAGKRVLVVEDVLTTGASARTVINATRAFGGHVVGLGVLCNRGGVITAHAVADVPKFIALVNVNLAAYNEAECLLCKWGIPINTAVGKGREFLARKRA